MNEYMSEWEIKRNSDDMILNAIHEVKQDHLASICSGHSASRSGRWLMLMLALAIVASCIVLVVG